MTDDMRERVKTLERRVRRWRLLAVGSWVFILVVGIAVSLAAWTAAVRERAAAEDALREAEKARQGEEEARDEVRRQLYFRHVSLAQQQWQQAGERQP
jgi:hypothetical protein